MHFRFYGILFAQKHQHRPHASMKNTVLPNIIDVEASGFGSHSYPIEVGIAMSDGQRFCSLIEPAPDWTHWDPEAEKVHKVSRENLHTHGKPLQDVASKLNRLLSGKTLYSDGWVVDKPWLITLFERADLMMDFTISPLEIILTEQQMTLWHQTKDRITLASNLQRHRASNDAWIIQETYRQTKHLALCY